MNAFRCKLTRKLMKDPVMLGTTGHTYERKAIKNWFKENNYDPFSHNFIPPDERLFIPNFALRDAIEAYMGANELSPIRSARHTELLKDRIVSIRTFKHIGLFLVLIFLMVSSRNFMTGPIVKCNRERLAKTISKLHGEFDRIKCLEHISSTKCRHLMYPKEKDEKSSVSATSSKTKLPSFPVKKDVRILQKTHDHATKSEREI